MSNDLLNLKKSQTMWNPRHKTGEKERLYTRVYHLVERVQFDMNKVYWCKGQSKRVNTTISINFKAEEEWQYTEDPITFQILLQSISTVHLKWSRKLKVANTKTQRVNALRWIGKALTKLKNSSEFNFQNSNRKPVYIFGNLNFPFSQHWSAS
jgi:hypothetical protein